MAVISIHETTFDDQRVYVEATVEDMVLVHAQTMLDPAEYGPALCEASFAVDPEVPFPHDGAAFLRYVDDLDLNWKVIDTSDQYLDWLNCPGHDTKLPFFYTFVFMYFNATQTKNYQKTTQRFIRWSC